MFNFLILYFPLIISFLYIALYLLISLSIISSENSSSYILEAEINLKNISISFFFFYFWSFDFLIILNKQQYFSLFLVFDKERKELKHDKNSSKEIILF